MKLYYQKATNEYQCNICHQMIAALEIEVHIDQCNKNYQIAGYYRRKARVGEWAGNK